MFHFSRRAISTVSLLMLTTTAGFTCPSQNPDAIELASSCPSHPKMRIPNWGLQANLRSKTSSQPLDWGSPSTWLDAKTGQPANRIPNVNDNVLIAPDSAVFLDDILNQARIITVRGNLQFARAARVTLRANTILVNYDGTLDVGRPGRNGQAAQPITGSARIQLAVGGLLPKHYRTPTPDKTFLYTETYNVQQPIPYDPRELGAGLIVLGKFYSAGLPKTSFVRLAKAPNAGNMTLECQSAPQGWRQNDRLIVPDTRDPYQRQFIDNSPESRSEQLGCFMTGGTTVRLMTGLRWNHPGNDTFLPHVANLTRNVTVETFSYHVPTQTRAHILVSGPALVDVDNTSFNELGRTRAGVPTTNLDAVDSGGNPTPTEGNQIGRYAMHFHMADGEFAEFDPEDERTAYTRHRARITHCAFNNSYRLSTFDPATYPGGLKSYPDKWQVAIHQTTRVLVQGNVFYGVKGAGVVTEDGNETWNEIIANFAVNIPGVLPENTPWTPGTTDGAPYFGSQVIGDPRHDPRIRGSEGSGFWFAGDGTMVWNNVAADCAFGVLTIPQKYSPSRWTFTYPMKPADNRATWTRLKDPTNDSLPFGWNKGDLPYVKDSDGDPLDPTYNVYGGNETYACLTGFERWFAPGLIIRDTKIWNCHSGMELWGTGDGYCQVDGVVVRGDGDPRVMASGDPKRNWQYHPDGWEPTIGINGRFHIVPSLIRNVDVKDMQIGLQLASPMGRVSDDRKFNLMVENVKVACPQGIIVYADQHYKNDQFQGTPNLSPSQTLLRNVVFDAPSAGGKVNALQTQLAPFFYWDIMPHARDEVYLDGFRVGNSPVNQGRFRVYYPEQSGDYLYPTLAMSPRGGYGTTRLKNSEVWNLSVNDPQGRKAMMGSVAPGNAVTWEQGNFRMGEDAPFRRPLLAPVSESDIAALLPFQGPGPYQPYNIDGYVKLNFDLITGECWTKARYTKPFVAVYLNNELLGTAECLEQGLENEGENRRKAFRMVIPDSLQRQYAGQSVSVRVYVDGPDGVLGTGDDILFKQGAITMPR